MASITVSGFRKQFVLTVVAMLRTELTAALVAICVMWLSIGEIRSNGSPRWLWHTLLAVFLGIIIIFGIALIAVFAPEHTTIALLIVGELAFSIFALAYDLGGERHSRKHPARC